MRFSFRVLVHLAALVGPLLQASAQPARRLAPDLALAMPISADVANDGSVVVADVNDQAVHLIGPSGTLRWSITAKGSGPGDVLRPYRISMGDSTVWIYDFAVRDISIFTRSGKFLRRIRPSMSFRTVDEVVAIGDTLMAVLGITRQAGSETKAIHVFDANGVYKRSFGDAAFASDRAKLEMSGTGTLALTPKKTLLYARKGPFQILEYTAAGVQIRALTTPIRIESVIDSMTAMEVNEKSRETIKSRADKIRYPTRAVPLSNGFVLSGVSDRGIIRRWVQAPTGESISVTMSKDYSPAAWNAKTCELLVITGGDEEPAIMVVSGRSIFPQSTLKAMRCK